MDMEDEKKQPLRLLDNEAAQYDKVAKEVLSFRIILAYLTKYCTEEFRDMAIEDIAGKSIEGSPIISHTPVDRGIAGALRIRGENTEDNDASEGTITYDILFRAVTPGGEPVAIIVNVEMQKSSRLPYPLMKRVMYYLSRLVSAQKGTEFKGSDYGGIKKVYTIWILMDTPDGESGITSYAMQETPVAGRIGQEKRNYDVMRAVMVYVGEKQAKQISRLIRLLYLLFKANRPTGTKLKELEEEFGITLTEEQEKEVDTMCNLSYGIAERNYNYGVLAGHKKGKAEGRAEGKAQGRAEERIEMLRAYMESLHLTAEQAMDAARISREEQEKLKPLLEK